MDTLKAHTTKDKIMTFLIFAACIFTGLTIYRAIRPILEGLRII